MISRYAAIAFGRPCGIDDSDCEVPEIQEPADGLTHLTYHIEKCRLYRIVGTFLGRRKESKRSGTISDVHKTLQGWFVSLPAELKMTSEAGNSAIPNTMEMQSLVLQLAYDNIQIVLHRQAVFGSQHSESSKEQAAASVQQLVESALRTASTPANAAILPICQSSHAAMHVAICLFTAGVILSAFHLAHDFRSQSDELLPGLERIISFFKSFPGQNYRLTTQCLEILQTLHLKCIHPPSDVDAAQRPVPEAARDGKTCISEIVCTRFRPF